MDDREGGERGSGISVLMVRHDNDNDDDKFLVAGVFEFFPVCFIFQWESLSL